MFKIPFENIASKVDASEKLTKGLRFIETICNDMVIPDGIVPMIAGGAARDVLIKNVEPHDIDIFFVRNAAGILSNDQMQLMFENLQLWLEDKEIEWTSLARNSYPNDDSYLEIMDFTFEGVNIQLMIPSQLRAMDTVIDRFPLMCRAMVNHTGLYVTATGFCSMCFDRPVMVNERDLRYCQKKYPDSEVYSFVSGNEMYYNFLGRIAGNLVGGEEDPLETVRVPTTGATFTQWPTANGLSERFRKAFRAFFNLPESYTATNQAYSAEIGGNYTRERRSAQRRSVTVSTTQTAIRWQW